MDLWGKGMACKSNIMILNKALIVRILSLSLCLILGISFGQASNTLDALNSYKELQSNFISDKDKFSEVHPEPTFLPSLERIQPSPFGEMPSSRPVIEENAMTGDNSKLQVQDIEAFNTVKQRTIVYDDVQRGDGVNKGNSMNIEISRDGQEKQSVMDLDDDFGNAIEEKVDSAITSSTNHESGDNTDTIHSQVNNLNIDVSGISVRAINTVPGGTAIATSNIKIEPVQIIVEQSEAGEKLK
jgi:hypothetical protein